MYQQLEYNHSKEKVRLGKNTETISTGDMADGSTKRRKEIKASIIIQMVAEASKLQLFLCRHMLVCFSPPCLGFPISYIEILA